MARDPGGTEAGARMMKQGWLILVAAAGAAVSARAQADGLAGLDAELNATGRIGTYTPEPTRIAPATPDAGAPASPRERAPTTARSDDNAAPPRARATDLKTDAEVQPTDGAVASCRIEVARRRRVTPAAVAAGTVVLRFTIERSGRVRNAEALSAEGTDLEVAACAKRVISDWVFAKRPQGAAVVQRTYRFAGRG
jgi:outer membrane biosynthesis protein TonB